MDLEANVKSLEEKIHNIEGTLEGEASLANAKIEKISGENEALRRIKYELESNLKNSTVEREHIVVLNEELSVRIVEFEVQVKEMRSQYESLQVEHQKQELQLRERVERSAQDSGVLSELQEVLDMERTRADELQVSLNDSETDREALVGRMEELDRRAQQFGQIEETNRQLSSEVEELTKKNEFLFGEIAKERVRLEAKIETLVEALEAKKKEYSIKEFEVSQLQSENLQLISYKRQVRNGFLRQPLNCLFRC
jgi:chromosome segregation ATPase